MESLAGAFENAFSAGCWAITFKIAAGFLVGKEIPLLLQGNVANQGSRGGGKWREREGREVTSTSCVSIIIPLEHVKNGFTLNTLSV